MVGKKTARELGRWGEDLAKSFLEGKGYQVMFQNVFTEYGEIDLVAKRKNQIHFVEVKTRRTKDFGHPEESITQSKLSHMIDSAEAFLQAHPEFEGSWQIDVIAILVTKQDKAPEIRFFENAQ
jgi:putative endonuclease